MKRKLATFVLLCSFSLCVAPWVGRSDENNDEEDIESSSVMELESPQIEEIPIADIVEKQMITVTKSNELSEEELFAQEQKQKLIELQQKLDDLNNSDITKMEWFIKYKELQQEYSQWFDPEETIYDYYTVEEINILHRIVEAECTGLDFDKKVNVSNVIFNRLDSEEFPNTVEEVVFQKKPTLQFAPIGDKRYYSVEPQEDTLLAIEYAFMFLDTTEGALFFEATYSNEIYGEIIMCDGSHKFY